MLEFIVVFFKQKLLNNFFKSDSVAYKRVAYKKSCIFASLL